MYSVIRYSVLFVILLHQVNGDYRLQLQFHRYDNPSNRLASGECCDDYFCFSSCDTLFRSVCLRNGGTSHSQAGHCIPGTIHHNPGSIGGNTVIFYQSIGSLSNPFHYTRPGNIPESGFQLYLEVWDDDSIYDDFIDRIVHDVPAQQVLVPVSDRVFGEYNRVSLVLSYSLSCIQNYYGSDCSENCIPYNDNDNGHYTCNITNGAKICRDGWQNETNNCRDVACRLVCQSPGGVCSSDGVCQCNPNWLGDECHIPQCSEGCHPQGGYCDEPEECLCRNNWSGTFCNESSCTVNCSSIGGQCLEPDACSCLPGYTGDACEIDLLPCEHQVPCQNEGNCSEIGDSTGISFTCSCSVGFTGLFCDIDIDECAIEPCHNNGTCINEEAGSYSCICPTGWTGESCSDAIDYCESNPCINSGNCTSLNNGHYCVCDSQYEGLNCELLINACLPNPCKNNGTCVNLVYNYTCSCLEGFTGTICESQTSTTPLPANTMPIGAIIGSIVGLIILIAAFTSMIVIILIIRRQCLKNRDKSSNTIYTLVKDDKIGTLPSSSGNYDVTNHKLIKMNSTEADYAKLQQQEAEYQEIDEPELNAESKEEELYSNPAYGESTEYRVVPNPLYGGVGDTEQHQALYAAIPESH